MTTYLVNALGNGSNPADGNPAHGAINFTNLLSFIGSQPQNGDIIEVTDDAEIVQPTGIIDLGGNSFTLRSYAGNATKATIKGPMTTDTWHTFSIGGPGTPVVKNLQFYRDAATLGPYYSGIVSPTGGIVIDSCRFYYTNSASATAPFWGIVPVGNTPTQPSEILNCIFENMPSPAIMFFSPNGAFGAYNIVNCTFYKCTLFPGLHPYKGVIQQNSNTGRPGIINVHNCTLYGNNGADFAFHCYDNVSADVVEDKNILFNFATAYHNISAGGATVTADPLFVDGPGNNLHLSAGSPCIDTGLPVGGSFNVPAYDYDGIVRPQEFGVDIGAYEAVGAAMPTVNRFSSSAAADGVSITSIVDKNHIVNLIQAYDADPYFDTTSELSKVSVHYVHQDGRQFKKLIHRMDGTNLACFASWAPGAKDGTWQKTKVQAYDINFASVDLPRSVIGTGEDLTHSDGTMSLNT